METLPDAQSPAVPKRKYRYTVKTGRPTKYKPEYCDEIIQYFDIEPYRKEVMEEKAEFFNNGKERSVSRKYQMVSNKLPTLYRFAQKIGVDKSTLLEWASVHDDFSRALEKSKEMQKEFLIDAGMAGASNPAMTIFTAKNITDMRDKVEPVNIQHQVFFIPREIAAKHGLALPEAEAPLHVEARLIDAPSSSS